MLRWHRLGFFVVSISAFDVKTCSRMQPENLSQRVCIYVNMLLFYNMLC
jgi:hypothetical protein